jgi:hypothetical protein
MRRASHVIRLIVLIGWLAGLLWISPKRVFACSCIMEAGLTEAETILKAIEDATAVFAGEVTAIQSDSTDNIQVQFAVSKVWKGEIYSQTTVLTGSSGSSCRYDFDAGEEYLVYTYTYERVLHTGLCYRNALLRDTTLDRALLGEGAEPLPGTASPTSAPDVREAATSIPHLSDDLAVSRPQIPIVAGIVMAVGLALLAAIWVYRRGWQRRG